MVPAAAFEAREAGTRLDSVTDRHSVVPQGRALPATAAGNTETVNTITVP